MVKIFLVFIICVVIVTGCASTAQIHPNPIPTLEMTPSIVPSPVPTSTPLLKPTISSSPTPTSSFPEPRVTLPPFPGGVEESFENPVCKFPCWWGITPGITTWEDSKNLFLSLGFSLHTKVDDEYVSHEAEINQPESIYNTRIKIYTKDDKVEYIAIKSFLPQADFQKRYSAYELKKILRSYGIPSRILTFASLLGDGTYGLDLFYDEEGFLISYGGNVHADKSGNPVVCPDFSYGSIEGIGIYLQSPNIAQKIENFPDEELKTSFRISEGYLHPIERVTGLTPQEFSNLFIGDNPSYCFTILR